MGTSSGSSSGRVSASDDLLAGIVRLPKQGKEVQDQSFTNSVGQDRTEFQQTAFDTLKERLVNPPVLAHADYHLHFKLHTGTSNADLGVVFV